MNITYGSMVQEVPNLLFLEAAMVAVSGGASGVIEDPYRFLPLIFHNESACCVLCFKISMRSSVMYVYCFFFSLG